MEKVDRPLDKMARQAISDMAYTADGQRLMLPIDGLVALELISPELKAAVAAALAEFWAKCDAASMSRFVIFDDWIGLQKED